MSGSPPFAHIKTDVVAIIAALPRGRVTSFTAIGTCLGVMPRHVQTIVADLDAAEATSLPWHRVVADGGAVGRHPRRDEQMARLKADGLTVSPVGIVAGLEHAMLTAVTRPLPGKGPPTAAGATADGADAPPSESTPSPPSRSRGRFDRPGTKIT